VAKLVAQLNATAALWVRIQTTPKKYTNGRHKQRSGKHTLAFHKYIQKKYSRINRGVMGEKHGYFLGIDM
jgi:hypothetical protein